MQKQNTNNYNSKNPLFESVSVPDTKLDKTRENTSKIKTIKKTEKQRERQPKQSQTSNTMIDIVIADENQNFEQEKL